MPSVRGSLGLQTPRYCAQPTILETLEPRLLFTAVPLITEFLASNDNGLVDEDGDASDWIELYNAGDAALDLDGWHLTDDAGDLAQWSFPDVSLAPGQYIIVFASDKDRADNDGTELHTNFKLGAGGEYLALVQPDGVTVAQDYAPQYPSQVEDVSYGLAGADPLSLAYFAAPTPGAANGSPLTTGPIIGEVERDMQQPTSGQAVTVTAEVTEIAGIEEVLLQYQVVAPGSYIRLTDAAYQSSWVSLTMNDNGTSGDVVAGDGVFTATISGGVQQHRRLIRYRVVAEDTAGNTSQAPIALDAQPNAAYFVYDGVPDWTGADRPGVTTPVTYGSDVLNSLPVYQLIANASDVTNSQYSGGSNGVDFLGTFVYNGVVYDHVEFKNRGQNSTYVSGKNKWKIKFNDGHAFQWHDDFGNPYGTPLKEMNLGAANSPWAPGNRGLAGMDEAIAFRLFNMAGVPAPFTQTAHFRVIDSASEQGATQYASDLWGLYVAFEDTSGRFLDAHDLSRDGDLFRLQSGASRFLHQGSGTPGDMSAFNEFTNGGTNAYNRGAGQSEAWWRANVNLDSYYSYRAVLEALNHNDIRDLENANLYYDPATDKWTMLPWDVDLLYEQFDRWGPDGLQNASSLEKFRNALVHDAIEREFQARARELQDLLLNDEQIGLLVDEYADYVEPFAAVDRAMWDYHPRTTSNHVGRFYNDPYVYQGSFSPGVIGQVRDLTSGDHAGMVQYVKTFLSQSGFGGAQLAVLADDELIPDTPSLTHTGPAGFAANQLTFTSSSFSGNAAFLGMQWRLAEVTDPSAPAYDPNARPLYEIDSAWESGTLTSFDPAFTVPFDQVQQGHAYRLRVRVQDATGRWSHWSDAQQFVVTDATSSTSPIRISELHYNPQGPTPTEIAAGFGDGDEFEFIELLNTSTTQTINLADFRMLRTTVNGDGEGITYTFGPLVLAPGERAVITENTAAFTLRYGTGISIAGQYSGKLADGGETLRLTDAGGATIHQFAYDDVYPWPTTPDGDGPSLVIVNTNGDYNEGDNWAASTTTHGTPGADESPLLVGDLNLDGSVNGQDLAILSANFGSTGQTLATGDITGDGSVNGQDLAILAASFGTAATPAPAESQDDSAANQPPPLQPESPAQPEAKAVVESEPPKKRTLLGLLSQRVQLAAASRPTANALILARPSRPIAQLDELTSNDEANTHDREPHEKSSRPRRFNALTM